MRRLRRMSDTVQVRLGTAVAVLYVAAISLVASDHVARGARVRTRTPSRAPRNGSSADLVSRHP